MAVDENICSSKMCESSNSTTVAFGGFVKITLTKNGFFRSRLSISKWSKHGQTSLFVSGHDTPVDITIFSDVASNPGPEPQPTSARKVPSQRKSNTKIPRINARSTQKNLRRAHLNTRSIKCRDHFVLVKDTILTNKFDVFTISESWLDSTVSDLEIEVPGYSIYRVDRNVQEGGGV